MAIRKVAQMGAPVLRRLADDIDPDLARASSTRRIMRDLIETMIEYDGVGLAAPQIHESVKIVCVNAEALGIPTKRDDGRLIIINPKLRDFSDTLVSGWEGCLSVEGLLGKVDRADGVKIDGLDHNGQELHLDLTGYPARVLQHEVDHLFGKLYVERMTDLTTLCFSREFNRYLREEEELADRG